VLVGVSPSLSISAVLSGHQNQMILLNLITNIFHLHHKACPFQFALLRIKIETIIYLLQITELENNLIDLIFNSFLFHKPRNQELFLLQA
jgi:hypothetical protein